MILALTGCAALLAACGASLPSDTAGLGQPHIDAVSTPSSPADAATASADSAPATGQPGSSAAVRSSVGVPAVVNGAQKPPVQTASLSTAAGSADLTGAPARAPSPRDFTSMSEPGHVAYRVGPLDVLEISVFRVPELSKTVQVADTGTINLPLIGEVPASGRTAQEIEQDVTARLGAEYLQKPQVTVFIKEYNARRVTVDGSVRKPGVYPLRGKTSLLQVITMAEGLDYNRASSDVVVFRQVGGKRTAARFDLDEIRAGTANDPLMEPGDVVIVDDNAAKIVLLNILRVLPVTNVFMGVL